MPFREKSAWISFGVTLVAWGGYFFHTYIWPGDMHGRLAMHLLGAALLVTVVVQVALRVLIAVQAPRDARSPADERDQLIALKATRWAYYVLVAAALAAIGTMHLGADITDVGNAVLGAVMVSELARCLAVIAAYRRGA